MGLGHPLVGYLIGLQRKSVGDCIGYRPTTGGFSHCPSIVGRQRRSPTLVYAINASDDIPPGILCRIQDNYISTDIYSCSILDCNTKFCENSRESRISADKRFHYVCFPPSTPDRGFQAVCNRKFNTKFKRHKEFMINFRPQLRIFHLPLSGFIIRLATLCSDSRSIGPSPIRYGHEKGGLPPPFKLNYMF